jgi:hypothetical protein
MWRLSFLEGRRRTCAHHPHGSPGFTGVGGLDLDLDDRAYEEFALYLPIRQPKGCLAVIIL